MDSKFANTVLAIIACIGLVGIGAGIFIATTPGHFVKKDSGVAACKTLAENMAKKSSSDKPMTEAEYHRIRAPFENSSHADIKVAGMNIVDTVYQAQTLKDPNNIGAALILMNSLQGQWGQLQVACNKQGVDLPQLPVNR